MSKAITKVILSFLVLVLIAIWAEIAKSPNANEVKVFFLNVGQGDAALIEKGDYQILIDGGPDSSVLSEIAKIMPISDRKIETVILTHPHADHLLGLNQVLERYEIGRIYMSGVAHTSNQYLEFLSQIKAKNISTEVPELNQEASTFDGAALKFLWPGKKYLGQSSCSNSSSDSETGKTDSGGCVENLNNVSEVAEFCYFEQCALFLGDLQTDGQAEMAAMNKTANYQAQILKIAHHGSTNGTNQALIDLVKPQYAIIEVGAENKYGHPHAATLDLLAKSGIKTLRTDCEGTITFILTPAETLLKN